MSIKQQQIKRIYSVKVTGVIEKGVIISQGETIIYRKILHKS